MEGAGASALNLNRGDLSREPSEKKQVCAYLTFCFMHVFAAVRESESDVCSVFAEVRAREDSERSEHGF